MFRWSRREPRWRPFTRASPRSITRIWTRGNLRLHFAPLKEKVVGNARSALMVMFGAVGFVLLIASANVANLLLARASTRRREVAIRAAIGAGRGRLVRQFLAESVLLALFGGAAGVLVARWALAVMVRLGSGILPRVAEATLDARVLLFALAVSLATGVLFGLGPALSFGRAHLHDALKDDAGGFSAGAGRLRLRGLLVAGELALAIVLLTGAGLMLRSFWRMNTYPPGFAPEKILVMRVALSGPEYNVWLREDAYLHELMRRVKSAPGVQEVGIDRSTLNVNFHLEGASPGTSEHEPAAAFRAVSPGYLRALGVPLIKGSWPRDDESFDSLMVNETFVRTMMGSGDPIGRRIDATVSEWHHRGGRRRFQVLATGRRARTGSLLSLSALPGGPLDQGDRPDVGRPKGSGADDQEIGFRD